MSTLAYQPSGAPACTPSASWNSARLPKVGASVVTVHALPDEMPPESAT